MDGIIAFCKKHIKSLAVCAALLLSAAIAALLYRNATTASMILSLNYAEASDGRYPNGTRFEESDILSDEVLEHAIELSALDADASTLLSHLTMTPVSNSSGYIETSYRIRYTQIFGTSAAPENVLKMLYVSYYTWFMESYSDNYSVLAFSGVEDGDYPETVSALTVSAQKISDYLNGRLKENSTFVSESAGADFQHLKDEADSIINVSIANLGAYVRENGISKDAGAQSSLLEYRNKMLSIKYDNYTASYRIRVEAIADYDGDMASVVRIPSVNDEGGYFMGRTKVGIDHLAADADYFLEQASYISSEIADNSDILSKLGSNPTDAAAARADAMIESITASLSELSDRAIKADKDYIQYKTLNYLSYIIE